MGMEVGRSPEDLQKTVEALQAQLVAKERKLRASQEREKRGSGPENALTANNERVVLNAKRTDLLEIQKRETIVRAKTMPKDFEIAVVILGSDWLFVNDVVMKLKHGVCTVLSPKGKPMNLHALRLKHLPSIEAVTHAAAASGGLVELVEPLSVGQTARLLRKGCRSLVQPGSESDKELLRCWTSCVAARLIAEYVAANGKPQYTIEKVVGHRLEPSKRKDKGKCKKRRLEFLVKWQGHGDEHYTWELSTHVVGCQELMAGYMAEHNLGAEVEDAADGEAEAKDDVEAEAQA
ncbi:hypothetical protein QJQ45_014436 [Haematococcus lacustris]|nr:hypothetical protein QJQ45_014436 [Haematococcus lacustris]